MISFGSFDPFGPFFVLWIWKTDLRVMRDAERGRASSYLQPFLRRFCCKQVKVRANFANSNGEKDIIRVRMLNG
jgi:hypothetical protein